MGDPRNADMENIHLPLDISTYLSLPLSFNISLLPKSLISNKLS